MDILIILAVYTILVLFFVPLKKIGTAQDKVKSTLNKWIDKLKD